MILSGDLVRTHVSPSWSSTTCQGCLPPLRAILMPYHAAVKCAAVEDGFGGSELILSYLDNVGPSGGRAVYLRDRAGELLQLN